MFTLKRTMKDKPENRQASDLVSDAPLISGLSARAYHELEKFVLIERPNIAAAIDWDAIFNDLSV